MNKQTMTKCVAIFLLAMLSVPAFSQVRFGVRGEVGMNNPSFSPNAIKVENLTSWSIGPSMELMLPITGFGVDLALLYNDNRMNVNPVSTPGGADASIASQSVANRYLLLPVNAKKKFGLGILPAQLFATAGPYVGYLISGDKIDFPSINEDIKATNFQAGIGLGFGVEVLSRLQVSANWRAQLTDNYASNTPGIGDIISPFNKKKSSWTIGAAVYF